MALEEKIWEVDTRIKKIAFGGLTPSEIGDLGSSSQLMSCVCAVNTNNLMYWWLRNKDSGMSATQHGFKVCSVPSGVADVCYLLGD